jgi:hypothetical protein
VFLPENTVCRRAHGVDTTKRTRGSFPSATLSQSPSPQRGEGPFNAVCQHGSLFPLSLADLNLFQVMGFRSTKREEKASSPLSEEKGESDLTSCSIISPLRERVRVREIAALRSDALTRPLPRGEGEKRSRCP